MLRWIKLAVIILCAVALIYFSAVKINDIVIKDVHVVNLVKLYKIKGFPVDAKKIVKQKHGIFIKDITLVKNKNGSFTAFISKDLLQQIKIGSIVFLPKSYDRYASSSEYVLGKVTNINRVMDWQTGFYLVTVNIPANVPNMTFYTGKVVYKEMDNIILVPIRILESTGNQYYAWRVDGDKAKRVKIEVGTCDGYNCEIKSGLSIGDRIVSSDLKLLTDGLFLHVINDNSTQDMMQFSVDGAVK